MAQVFNFFCVIPDVIFGNMYILKNLIEIREKPSFKIYQIQTKSSHIRKRCRIYETFVTGTKCIIEIVT